MAPPRCVIDPAATTNRANGTYNRHFARGGDDDPRRGNSLPREGLQLCVAPYFADGCRRHAGTVEVHRENATPEAVAGCHRTTLPTRYTADTQYTIFGATAPHPAGVRFGGCPSAVPACRHDPAWRNTGLRTAATTCRGGGNVRLCSSSLPLAERRTLRCARPQRYGGVPLAHIIYVSCDPGTTS